MPHRHAEPVRITQAQLNPSGLLYPTPFTGHHWIAGIFSLQWDDGGHLGIFDPSPFPIAQMDFQKSLKQAPSTPLGRKGMWARKEPRINDCRLHLVANFFADFLGDTVADHLAIAQRLLEQLAPSLKKNKRRKELLASMKRETIRLPYLEGSPAKSTKHKRIEHTHRSVDGNSTRSSTTESEDTPSLFVIHIRSGDVFALPTQEPHIPFFETASWNQPALRWAEISTRPSAYGNTAKPNPPQK